MKIFSSAKEFLTAHKKGVAIAAGVAAVSVIAYKVYSGKNDGLGVELGPQDLDLAVGAVSDDATPASVYQS